MLFNTDAVTVSFSIGMGQCEAMWTLVVFNFVRAKAWQGKMCLLVRIVECTFHPIDTFVRILYDSQNQLLLKC